MEKVDSLATNSIRYKIYLCTLEMIDSSIVKEWLKSMTSPIGKRSTNVVITWKSYWQTKSTIFLSETEHVAHQL